MILNFFNKIKLKKKIKEGLVEYHPELSKSYLYLFQELDNIGIDIDSVSSMYVLGQIEYIEGAVQKIEKVLERKESLKLSSTEGFDIYKNYLNVIAIVESNTPDIIILAIPSIFGEIDKNKIKIIRKVSKEYFENKIITRKELFYNL